MQIYGWELLKLCHPDKSCDHKHCECGDNNFNLSRDLSLEFKGLFELMVGNPSQ